MATGLSHRFAGHAPFAACPARRYYSSLTIGGGFHLPVSASDFDAYGRIVRLNAPFGTGGIDGVERGCS